MATVNASPKPKEEDRTNQAFDKAKDASYQAAAKAKEAVVSVGEMASSAAAAAGKKVDDLAGCAGTGIKKLGETMAQKGPHDGILGSASQTVAKTIEEGGKYIEDAKLSGMADDVAQVIRDYPIPAILIGIGVGYVLGRAMRS